MWWRSVITTALLTLCTFIQAYGQTQVQTKDLLCVLLLSGLQKEDLDLTILKKLKKHNVNIDNMDSEEMRKKCTQLYANQTIDARRTNDNSTLETVKNKKNNIATTENKLILETNYNNKTIANVTQLFNLLSKVTKAKTRITTQPPSVKTTIQTNKQPSIDYISKMIEKYIAQTKVITTVAPTTINIRSIMDEIENIINNKKHATVNTEAQIEVTEPIEVETTVALTNNDDANNLMEILKTAINNIKSNKKPINNTRTTKPENIVSKSLRRDTKPQNVQTNIPKNFFEDIAKNVKELVLKELRKELTTITTTTKEEETTTPKDSKDQTLQLAQFMELFQQFKNDRTLIKSTTMNNIDKPSALIVYPLKIPSGVYQPLTPSPNIVQYVPNVQKLHQADALKNTLEYKSKPIHKIGQVNIFNREHQPLTMQSNRDEIPPLNIPLPPPLQLVYQNIVVTTIKPPERYDVRKRPEYLYYGDRINNNLNKKINGYPARELIKDYGNIDMRPHNFRDTVPNRAKYDRYKYGRSRDTPEYRDVYTENEYHRSSYDDRYAHNYDRIQNNDDNIKFHEKLERVDDYKSRERIKKNRKLKVASRKLRPLHEEKNHSKYDDTHFRNFLKTQQKVNDMLERILATKTISEKTLNSEIVTT